MLRRIALFVLLFGAGLALLLFLERRGPEAPEPPPRSEPAAGDEGGRIVLPPEDAKPKEGPPAQGEASEQQPPPAADGSQDPAHGAQVGLEGRFEYVDRERHGDVEVPRFKIEAEDARTLSGDRIVLRGAHVLLYEPVDPAGPPSTAPRALLELETERAEALLDTQSMPPGPDPREPLRFFETLLTAHHEVAFAPLQLRVPELSGTLDDQRFESESAVELSGRGLEAEGHGLRVTPGRVALLRDVQGSFALPGGDVGELSCAGALVLEERPELGPDGAGLVAEGGAHFVQKGALSIELRGERLTVAGVLRPLEGGDANASEFVPAWIEVEEDAEVALGDNTFRGERGRLEFDAEGLPREARLEGRPSVDLPLADVDPDALPIELPAGDAAALFVHVSGAGPLVLGLEEGERFHFAGPVELSSVPLGVQITAQTSLTGERDVDRSFSRLRAEGDVRGAFKGFELESAAIEILTPKPKRARLTVEAEAPTRLRGTLETGEPIDVSMSGRSLFEADGTSAWLRRAEGVEVILGAEEDLVRARADRVANLDLELLTFEAHGAVEVESNEGRGRAERVVRQSADRLRLFGTLQSPATYEFAEGRAQALIVDVQEHSVLAVGAADFEIALEGRVYELAARQVEVRREPDPDGAPSERLHVEAEGDAWIARREAGGGELAVSADWISATAHRATERDKGAEAEPEGAEDEQEEDPWSGIQTDSMFARGGVVFEARDAFEYEADARGEHLSMPTPGAVVLRGTTEERAHASGNFREAGLSLELDADQIEFRASSLSAEKPEVRLEGFVVPMGPLTGEREAMTLTATAGQLICDERSVIFQDDVRVVREGPSKEGWWLEAGRVSLSTPGTPTPSADLVGELVAWMGFEAHFGDELWAKGERLLANRATGLIRVSGAPATVSTPTFSGESTWIEWDTGTGLLRAEAGRLFATGSEEDDPWTMTFTTLEPVPQGDVAVQIVRQPEIRRGDTMIRASWAVFWVDPDEWRRYSTSFVAGEETEPEPFVERAERESVLGQESARRMPSLIAPLQAAGPAAWLREGYIEGDIEYFADDRRIGRSDEMYLDLVDGHGWIRNVELRYPMPFSSRPAEIKLQVDWMRHSADGSLRADNATITTCMFEKPHYRIVSGDLRLTPRAPKRGHEPYWELRFKKNAIVFGEGFALPLPDSFPIPLNKRGELHIDEAPGAVRNIGEAGEAVGGQTRRFGTFLRASFIQDIGNIGGWLNELIGGDPDQFEGKVAYDVGVLGSRGALLGIRPEIEQSGLYFLKLAANLVYDTGEDRGLVRVDPDERDDFRHWLKLRGRYLFDDDTWIDVVGSTQSDAGVQSEYWESDFLRFEERESFVHWRSADGSDYAHVTALLRTDDFRTEVEELPEAGYYHGGTKVGELGSAALLYESDTNAGYYRRLEGDPGAEIFQPPITDGLGDQEILRADTRHRLSAPLSVGDTGLKATPFLEARATVWDHGAEDEDAPARAGLLGGIELAGLFWREFAQGFRHELSPSITYRGDLLLSESGDTPIELDPTERSLEGQFVDFALRQRFVAPVEDTHADVTVAATWADQVADGEPDGWLPFAINGDFYSSIGDLPYALHHDARYDLDSGQTDYSRSRIGFEPWDPLEIELGYDSGRDPSGLSLYNAYTLAGRYRPSDKWEFEARTVFASQRDQNLSQHFTLRRFGHDLVFELEISSQAGEGSGFSISLVPLLTWRDSSLGLLQQHRDGKW